MVNRKVTFARLWRDALRHVAQNPDPISEAILILVAAARLGPNVTRFAEFIRVDREVVAAISVRMREAGLWRDDSVDDSEWLGRKGMESLWLQAHVALGQAIREKTDGGGVRYRDIASGKVIWDGGWVRT